MERSLSSFGRGPVSTCPGVIEALCNIACSLDDLQYMAIDCLLWLLQDPNTFHKVLYEDNEEEILVLKDEKWEIVRVKGKAPEKALTTTGSGFNQILGIKGAKRETVKFFVSFVLHVL
ncbi:hypothetical protein L6452_36769 [Arctium lappa]|uniref:Uncharacterized protein n=1 Tax=Arctium lappa TaxID=4217 RepID=A0ACB8Y250_ARCLA|nr:hypothetical protein L6452_36769 [Arctium lappa]